MKHFLTLFITALLATTASGAANVGVGSQPVMAALTNGHYFVMSTGNASNSPIRLIAVPTVKNGTTNPVAFGPGSIQITNDLSVGASASIGTDLSVGGTASATAGSFSGEVAASSFRVSGATNGTILTFESTNGVGVMEFQVHKDLSTKRTNIIGEVHASAAAVISFDTLTGNLFLVTNRISANLSQVLTNFNGAEMSGVVIGNASTPYTVTTIPNAGILVANLNNFSAALGTSVAETLTNGNALEWSAKIHRLNGTNVLGYVSRQFKL